VSFVGLLCYFCLVSAAAAETYTNLLNGQTCMSRCEIYRRNWSVVNITIISFESCYFRSTMAVLLAAVCAVGYIVS